MFLWKGETEFSCICWSKNNGWKSFYFYSCVFFRLWYHSKVSVAVTDHSDGYLSSQLDVYFQSPPPKYLFWRWGMGNWQTNMDCSNRIFNILVLQTQIQTLWCVERKMVMNFQVSNFLIEGNKIGQKLFSKIVSSQRVSVID